MIATECFFHYFCHSRLLMQSSRRRSQVELQQLAATGNVSGCLDVLDRLPEKQASHYNSALRACSYGREIQQAEELVAQMTSAEVAPNAT